MVKKKKKDTETNLKQIINMKIAREDLPKYVKLYPKWLLKIQRGKYRGTTIFPFGIYVKHFDYNDMDEFINHEHIHWKQQKEMLAIPFYLWYFIEYGVNFFRYKFDTNKAYKNISFEQEAYLYEKDMEYLKTRKFWSWLKYLKNKPVA